MSFKNKILLNTLADILDKNREAIVTANVNDVNTSYGINNDNLLRGISTLRAYAQMNIPKKNISGSAIYSCYGDPSFGIFGLTLAPVLAKSDIGKPILIGLPSILKNYKAELQHIFESNNILPNVEFVLGRKEFFNRIFANTELQNIIVFGDEWINKFTHQIIEHNKNLIFYGPGNNASIIAKGANVQMAIRNTLESAFMLNGQAAVCIERCIVDRSYNHSEIKDIFKHELQNIKAGINPFDSANFVTPITIEPLIETTNGLINDLTGKCEIVNYKTEETSNGILMSPTLVFDCNINSNLWKHFTFTPVLPVVFAKSDNIANIINNTNYGIYNSIWSSHETYNSINIATKQKHILNLHNKSILHYFSVNEGYTGTWGGYNNSGFIMNKTTKMNPTEGAFLLYNILE